MIHGCNSANIWPSGIISHKIDVHANSKISKNANAKNAVRTLSIKREREEC
jgi:hypothetical protein